MDDLDAALLEQIEATVLTPEALAYVVNKAEEAIRQSLAQIQAFERDLERLDAEIEGLEARARHGQLDVARALRELEPALAAWRGILRGNPVRARQILRKVNGVFAVAVGRDLFASVHLRTGGRARSHTHTTGGCYRMKLSGIGSCSSGVKTHPSLNVPRETSRRLA